MRSQAAENSDADAELAAEIARLNALLKQAAAEGEAVSESAASVADRHATELAKERDRTEAARADANELQHRVKNLLATVQAIANATLRTDVLYDEARTALRLRLQALARVQDLLFERNWTDSNLRNLIDSIVAPYTGSQSHRIRLRGPDIDVEARLAMVLALALNELATNAVKYGALSNDAGYIEIAWTNGPEIHLRWHERDGPSVRPPTRKGFGSRLVRDAIPAQFNGKVDLEFNPDGLICTISVPAPEPTRARQ